MQVPGEVKPDMGTQSWFAHARPADVRLAAKAGFRSRLSVSAGRYVNDRRIMSAQRSGVILRTLSFGIGASCMGKMIG